MQEFLSRDFGKITANEGLALPAKAPNLQTSNLKPYICAELKSYRWYNSLKILTPTSQARKAKHRKQRPVGLSV
jgi:hypothetical protein